MRDTWRDTILGRTNFGGHKKWSHGIPRDTQNLEDTKIPQKDTKGAQKMEKGHIFHGPNFFLSV